MLINLPNGKTISISAYEYLFMITEKEIDLFYQSCMADDLGTEIDNPFILSTKEREKLELTDPEFDFSSDNI